MNRYLNHSVSALAVAAVATIQLGTAPASAQDYTRFGIVEDLSLIHI